MDRKVRQRARQAIDKRLSGLKPENRFTPPPKGWIRAIRDALGMTGVQLAKRLSVRPQTVDALERSEASGSIQLGTLRRAAAALDCTLVYALVPNSSLEGAVAARAHMIAVREFERVAHTMKLEAQETGNAGKEERIEDYARSLDVRRLWDEP